jgi:predicted MFS family arabinose efflux permease
MREGYKRYVLCALTFVYGLTYVDRCLMILLLQPIKDDLRLTDTQLGFLTGIAFGLFYATLGLPIARWADRGNRVNLTALAIGLWGITVAACGLVSNFGQLVLARIAAAVGESGGMPPTYSLLGDYFTGVKERTRAMATYVLGPSIAALASFTVGGWLSGRLGWRTAFVVMGLPALFVAVLVRLTIAETRTEPRGKDESSDSIPSLGQVLQSLWRRPSTRHLGLGIILLWTMGLGLQPWYAAFLTRSHGMTVSELGPWLGLTTGIGSLLAIPLGSYVVNRWFVGNEKGQFLLTAASTAALVPACLLFLLAPNKTEALAAFTPLIMVFNFLIGPTFAVLQRLVLPAMRATTLAAVLLLANLVGMGFGPQVVGILSDLLAPRFGADALRYSMLITSVIALWAAYHFYRVGRAIRHDLQSLSGTVLACER